MDLDRVMLSLLSLLTLIVLTSVTIYGLQERDSIPKPVQAETGIMPETESPTIEMQNESEAADSSAEPTSAASSEAVSTTSTSASADAANTETTSTTAVNDGKIHVTAIYLTFTEIKLTVGETDVPYVTMIPEDAENQNEIWKSSDPQIAEVDEKGYITAKKAGNCIVTVSSEDNPLVKKDVAVTVVDAPVSPDTVTEPTVMNGIIVVNKSYPLPRNYDPGSLTEECESAFQEMQSGAAEDGISIWMESGYRSYYTQIDLYDQYVSVYGNEIADTFSARAGYSEHQTGLAIDCNEISDSFIGTPEAEWIEKHCAEYGFIVRYPLNKQGITGYKYEPWHIRYVGKENAKKITASGKCLEEYLGITSFYP